MAFKSSPSPERIPFNAEIGQKRGTGQDNTVYQLVNSAEKPHLRQPTGLVVKINHDNAADHRIRYADDRMAAEKGLQYKKNKYDILKAFLGDFVPETFFVLGQVRAKGSSFRYAEYTLQQEVPRVSLSDLTADQRGSDALKGNVLNLMASLQRMYRILGEVNARTAQGVTLDGKLDLGGVSDYVLSEDLDDGLRHEFTDEDAKQIINSNKSPNLLVDPESLNLYCIDFDQGQWYPGMDEAKQKALDLLARETTAGMQIGSVAVAENFTQQSFIFK